MKLVTFSLSGQSRLGVLRADGAIADVSRADSGIPADMREFLAGGEALRQRAESVAGGIAAEYVLDTQTAHIGPPIPHPDKILCIGVNYKDHIEETNSETPEHPVVFSKYSNTIIGPGDAIHLPAISEMVDYEAEFAVVMGRTARNVAKADALDYVGGYTILNDVSARDFQKRTSQWTIGKSFDTFAPIGPVLVTPDEIPDPHTLDIKLRLNGVEMQSSNTAQLLFNVNALIEDITAAITLQPGDIISTGTPGGVGMARDPQVLLKPGDEIEVEVEGIGVLRNPVIQGV